MLALDKPAHIPPDVHGRHEHRLLGVGRVLSGRLGYGAQEPLRRIGIKRKECARRGLPDGLADRLLDRGVQQDRGQHVLPLRIHVADLALQGAADVLGEHDGILFLGAPLDERFKDAPQVADGYLLLHQPLEDFRNTLRGQQAGGFADQIGGAFLHLVEQVLGFLHTEER